MRSRLAYPGGWVPTWSLPSEFEVTDPSCAFCVRFVEIGWLHVASGRLVCPHCMRDPWAVRQVGEGKPPARPAGEEMAEKLLARLEVERVEDVELGIY